MFKRIFRDFFGDKPNTSVVCSSSSASQPQAAPRGGLRTTEGANCLSAVFSRGADSQSSVDNSRPDTGYVKAREAACGRSARERRPFSLFSGQQSKDSAVTTDALQDRRLAAVLWKKSSALGGRLARLAALRHAEPDTPVQANLGLPDRCSADFSNTSVRERVTCPPASAGQRPSATQQPPERHTFPKAIVCQPPRQRLESEDPRSESGWQCSRGAGVACRGQLLPAQPSATAAPTQQLMASRGAAAAASQLLAAREPGSLDSPQQLPPRPRPLPNHHQQQHHHHQQQQQHHEQQPQGQEPAWGLDQQEAAPPLDDRLLFLALDVPPSMLQLHPDGSWNIQMYDITHRLHRGYSSSVFKAVCRKSGADVVLKAYNLAGLSDFLVYQMLRELDIHSRLRHTGVVKLLAAFREDDLLVLVLEYVRGGSLDRVRRKLGGRMTEFQAMHLVLLPLLGVLSYLHERGIVHRDIKPENLLFTESWQLKLCDYGVSICTREERAVTRTGSREYMAPEVCSCPLKRLPEDNKDNLQLSYGTAVDVWSLGSLMYELLVGFTPFPGGPPARKEGASGSAGAALAFPGGISREARAFIRDCLELDPADRPTVQQLQEHAWVQEALADAANGVEGALLAEEERRWQRQGQWRRGPSRRAGLALAAADRQSAPGGAQF
ncbi:hypothetical protein PLESTF_000710000 [Pleodorina starrii]|nr:hypothetical protein PLESTM_001799200 [Pleodorina starrii]GLC68572.1 hypothetical protein PLESTF_000710000 [Pleodorina starrii]